MEYANERHIAHNVLAGGDKSELKSSEKRISVAIATYNGEKYIEEQLLSICRQTVKPNEIVISDDGSKDATLETVERVAESKDGQGIEWIVVTDNPRHGYCGNFEWALKHTSGDYVFLSDQDDVWIPNKAEEVLRIFKKCPDAQCVCHNADLIGKQGEPIEGAFDQLFETGKLKIPTGEHIKIDRDTFLADAVSWGGFHGMSLCLSRRFTEDIQPFPPTRGFHDRWATFCAILNDGMYFLNLPLALYRLHGNNACGNSAYRWNIVDRARKILNSFLHNTGSYADNYGMGIAMKERLFAKGYANHTACKIADRLIEIGKSVYAAETSGRIAGAAKLVKLFCTDIRYRRSGIGAFLQELAYILRYDRKQRTENAGGMVI